MSNCLLIVPVGLSTGAGSLGAGLLHLADQRGLKARKFLPILQSKEGIVNFTHSEPAMNVSRLQRYMSQNELDDALESIVSTYEEQKEDADLVVALGLVIDEQVPYAEMINQSMAKALDAKILLVATDTESDYRRMNTLLEIAAEAYGGVRSGRVVGCVISKAGAPRDIHGNIRPELFGTVGRPVPSVETLEKELPVFQQPGFQLFGIIPWNQKLIAPRTADLQQILPVRWINKGAGEQRHIEHVSIGAPEMKNFNALLYRCTLIIVAGDRDSVILASALAELNNTPMAGLLLTGGLTPSSTTMKLISPALEKGLPVLSTDLETYPCATRLPHLYSYLSKDDTQRYQSVLKHVVEHLDAEKFGQLFQSQGERRLSPAAFRYNLIKVARKLKKTIVLPEGDEPRTVSAAITCVEKGIANCLLLADPDRVKRRAEAQGITLPEALQIVNPAIIRDKYVDGLVRLREHKGMNPVRAKQLLEDNVVLGTMMLQQGDVDGLVSGAVNTTANTILPALQLIKTQAGASLVSSIFFMCLPDQVLVYGDCAVNPDPTAEQLADIAIQSADSAIAFGIPARVAMISYSTGASGQGSDVDKVVQATALAKERRPDLLIDGPLQYDAATNAGVAKKKAPDSPVAGKATVFIFPDLNTGNTTYKAVQRSANVVSVGPMLQGMNKPVNDLSRGALVDDIIYTIALTVIQGGSAAYKN